MKKENIISDVFYLIIFLVLYYSGYVAWSERRYQKRSYPNG